MSDKERGFTITEMMVAMAFLTFMLIFLMTAIVQVVRIYNKGLSIRQINQAGRQFAEDFTRTARYGSTPTYNATLKRICVNGVTYAWNLYDPTTPAAMAAANRNRYISAPGEAISMVRVSDGGGTLCGGGDINKSVSQEVISTDINVKSVSFTTREAGRIVDVSVVFSTGGQNAPTTITPGPPPTFRCAGGTDGSFCAFGEFNATVYTRN